MTVMLHSINTSAIRAELARRTLAEFSRQAWPILEPATPLEWNWHLDLLCTQIQFALDEWKDVMMARRRGLPEPAQVLQNQIVNIPPGTGKSRFLNVFGNAWMWLHCPEWRLICISGNPKVTLRDARFCRDLIKSDWYQTQFIERLPKEKRWEIRQDHDAATSYANTFGGWRLSFGSGSTITGDRGDAIFADDLNDADKVASDTIREGVNDWWDSAAANRLNDLRTGVRIGIQQRLHEDDWTGHCLKSGQWHHVIVQQEYQIKHNCRCASCVSGVNPTGFDDPRKTEGELLDPVRFPPTVLATEKFRLGSQGYAGQHQQDPMAAGGNKFKKEWFRYYHVDGADYVLKTKTGIRRVPIKECSRITIGDFAFSIKTSADYTVLGTWDITRFGDVILVALLRKRMEDPDVEAAVEKVWDELSPSYVGIENKQNGATIIQRLSRKPRTTGRGPVRVKPIEADTDKITRSVPAQVDMENGKFFLPEGAEFLGEYESELMRFPNGAHDDQVDVTSYVAIEKSLVIPRITNWGTVTIAGS